MPGKVGFLGCGIMGAPMALNMVKAGQDVAVWNRSPGKTDELVKAGAKVFATKKEIVDHCDILFACVTDPVAAMDLVTGDDGIAQYFSSGKSFVDMSTVDEQTVEAIAAAITAKGGRYLEAPVSGSKVPAEQGTLLIICAGDEALFNESKECFDAMGKKSYYLGALGKGARMKLVINAVMGAHMAALAEGIKLAEAAELDTAVLHDLLCNGALSSPLVQGKGKALLAKSYPTNFPLKHQQKDLRLALQLSDQVRQQTPVIAATNELFKQAMARDKGDLDMCAVVTALDNK